MHAVVGIVCILLIVGVMVDAFQTIVLPRRASQPLRMSRYFYRSAWKLWTLASRPMRNINRRESYLGMFGPMSLLLLLVLWVLLLIAGFAGLQWAAGSSLNAVTGHPGFTTDLYQSGTTFFTLGLGDVTPLSPLARVVTVFEAGIGFGFLAVLIGYLPALYQAFADREVNIWLMTRHAGASMTAASWLSRYERVHDLPAVDQRLRDWEIWSAQLLTTQLAHAPLSYFRSQHPDESWVASLAVILDLCALLIVGIDGLPNEQARNTFDAACEAAIELSEPYLRLTRRRRQLLDRLPAADFARLRAVLSETGIALRRESDAEAHLAELRSEYEPYVQALGRYFLMFVPGWLPERTNDDRPRRSHWQRRASEKKESNQ